MKIITAILRRAAVFAAVLLALWAALVAAAAIPNERIYDNMYESAMFFKDKPPYVNKSQLRLIQDNYADVILLNVTWNMGSGNPFVSALNTAYYDGNDGTNDYGENWGFYCAVEGAEQPNTDYSRYWHGMAALIRPFMLFTDIDGIKLIGTITAFVLLAVNAALLIKKRQYFAAGGLVAALLCVHMWNIRLSMEYQPAVLVTLLLLPLYILLEQNDGALSILAVISGVMIAFFDFLTCETLTILIPLLIVFITRKQDNRLPDLRSNILLILKCGSAWGLSYAGTFLVKWSAASLVTGENKFVTALSSVEERLIGEAEQLSPVKQFFLAPMANISTLFGGCDRVSWGNIAAGLIISAVVFGAIFYLFRSSEKFDRSFNLTMLILGMLPFARFFLLNNHSYLHEFFTYRALASTILAIMAILWYSLEFRPKKKKSLAKGGKKHGRN
ncbi:MAG: hypothetical protein J6C96_01685 [Oscillospiraceae bacterium]|nr:hypothetical protein [Oscillospiraceae bacterium]